MIIRCSLCLDGRAQRCSCRTDCHCVSPGFCLNGLVGHRRRCSLQSQWNRSTRLGPGRRVWRNGHDASVGRSQAQALWQRQTRGEGGKGREREKKRAQPRRTGEERRESGSRVSMKRRTNRATHRIVQSTCSLPRFGFCPLLNLVANYQSHFFILAAPHRTGSSRLRGIVTTQRGNCCSIPHWWDCCRDLARS